MSKTTTLKDEFELKVSSEDLADFAGETEKYEPSEQTIRNILAFSKAYEAKPSKTINHIEAVLN